MVLAALATTLDVAKRGVTIEAGERDLLSTYLDVASAAVRQAAGTPISRATSTVELEGSWRQWLHLPGPPVVSVSDVTLDGTALVADTDYVLRNSQLWRLNGWQSFTTWAPSLVSVTQVHGLLTVPADIVDLVCRLAATALVAWRSDPSGSGLATQGNVRQLTLADYSVTYAASGQITEMTLPDQLRAQLAARFGNNAVTVGSR